MPALQAVSYHHDPLLTSPDADVVFRSSEGTYYRMHSFVLQTTSGFFRPMLSLIEYRWHPIGLEEDDGVLEKLFSMISGMEVPCWKSLEEMEGPTSIIHPLRQEHALILKRIPTDDLLRLIDLRRERRDAFIIAIDNEVQFTSGCNAQTCACSRPTDHHAWHALKLAMYMEMDERPIGTVVRNMDEGDWEAAEKCWNHQCRHCGRLVYDQLATMKRIRPCVDKLPSRLRPRMVQR
ncbi:uncharacterized protein EDB91DRAFT_1146981 [Suillus paluster]|uniref:uncharacterized protein n=1 Tax=Suillus paluster TaxID=48578 RepID=UPI001B885987|nr:uncharacterized protein EDB91DRAFT_1146981 [Suillus paluster]KAG1734204.1 hypothetical protein EDB91DRAFT_1146981 [Suillus paluster]